MDVSHYNIQWQSQSLNSGESMPCGGFDCGANVWVENNQIMMYIDRSGYFDENNQMLKTGRYRFSFSQNPFSTVFIQRLELESGHIVIYGDNNFKAVIWFEVSRPICHVDICSDLEIDLQASYESWRTENRELGYGDLGHGDRMAAMSYVCYPGKVITYKDNIITKDGSVTFFHQNSNENLLFDFLVKQQGLENILDKLDNPQKDFIFGGILTGKQCEYLGKTNGTYAGIEYNGYVLQSKMRNTHNFIIGFVSDNTESIDAWKKNVENTISGCMTNTELKKEALKWWSEYWDRSYIYINSDCNEKDKGFEISRNYALFRYMLGCNSQGKYPTKFNGGLFTTDPIYTIGSNNTFMSGDSQKGKTPDFRAWGGGSFTAQNQRLVYWPMLATGDFDLMIPQFEFYLKVYHNASLRSQEYWGHDGCSCTEQIENIGLPIGLTWGFPDTECPFFKRPKNFDPTELFCCATRYLYSTQLEFAYMILCFYHYSNKDISKYVPFIESCVRFYFEHYTKIHRENAIHPYDMEGKLVIFPSTALETYKDALNPTDAVAALWMVVSELATLPEYFDTNYYKELLTHIPEIKKGKIGDKTVILPAYSWTHVHNQELPQLYPVFPYPIYGIGRPDVKIAIDTWETAPEGQKNHISWHQDGIFTARLGLVDQSKEICQRKLENSGRRFPAFWGPGHDWVPDHNWGGSGMIGLQNMLVQQYDDTIFLFPAWPADWNVEAKLHLSNQTVLEIILADGVSSFRFISGKSNQKIVNCLSNSGSNLS